MIYPKLISSLFLVLISLSSFSQRLNPIENNESALESIMVINPQKQVLPNWSYDFSDVMENTGYTSGVSILVSHQHNRSRYSFTNFRNTNSLILGSTYQTNTTLGRRRLTGTYVFDVMGNLVDYQFTISKPK